MTPRETLQKYNLKTDVKSIRERVLFTDDFGEPSTALYRQQLWKLNGFHSSQIVSECHSADLTLICELAEKGEAMETPKTIYGYDTEDLITASKVLKLEGITPSMLHDTFLFARRCIKETEQAMHKAFDNVHAGFKTESEGEPK